MLYNLGTFYVNTNHHFRAIIEPVTFKCPSGIFHQLTILIFLGPQQRLKLHSASLHSNSKYTTDSIVFKGVVSLK